MLPDKARTKEQLVSELVGLRQRITELETLESERKQAGEKLQKSERKYRSLFENMINGFAYCKIIVDKNNKPIDFVHLEVNNAWERSIGLKREDVIGKKITEVIPGIKESETDLISIYGEVALTGKGTEFELYFEPLGKWFSITVYSPQEGYFVAVFDNITERKQAEEREKEMQQELNLASRLVAVGELAAGVAHEINNPLTGVLGFSERLLRKSTDEETRRDLERIHSEAQRITKVMDNLRTFTRHRELEKQYSDINDILHEALELRAYELRTGNIEIVTDLARSLPEIEVDFHQIQEVFLNIILNAEQAMTEAHGGGKLTIKTQKIKDYVRISFADDGSGIPTEHLDKLFDPFFTTRGEQGGTGLGLSVCHSIVTEHGGRLRGKSKPGEGATFFVELPCP